MTAIVAALLLTAAVLGLNAWLLQGEAAREVLTPEPAKVVQTFVGALAAGRADNAHHQLDERTRARLSVEELEALAHRLRARHGAFRYEGADEQRAGATADVTARLRVQDGGHLTPAFQLARDPGTSLWKITASDLLGERGRTTSGPPTR